MTKFKSILNKTAQITIAVVDCANTATLKTVGVITNEAANAVGASLDTLSDISARKLGGDKTPKGNFGYHYKVRHDNDRKLQKVLDGRMLPEHYVNEQLGDLLPADLMDKINDIINTKEVNHA